MKKISKFVLIILIILIVFIFTKQTSPIKMTTENIKIENNTVFLGSLSLRQKIAQMFMVRADKRNLALTDLNIGGIYVGGLKTEEAYKERIRKYQDKSKIKLLVATDLEGYWNPFSSFAKFPNLDEIKTREEAYDLGREHGKILKELGFNINFAPVAEIEDKVWKHRAFKGNVSEIKDKVKAYVKGLQEQGIIATLKHYPGGSLNIKNPHWRSVKAEISDEQLEIFDSAFSDAKAVMVGHPIVSGAIDSKGKPSTVSPEIVGALRKKFAGLIITDDISMRSLRNKYFLNEEKLFIDLVNAGNDFIIGIYLLGLFPGYDVNRKISYIEEAVKSGEIDGKNIDNSVRRILQAKGYNAI